MTGALRRIAPDLARAAEAIASRGGSLGVPLTIADETESTNDGKVALAIPIAQVSEQAGPLADHHQEAAPAGVVLLVRAQMLR